MVERVDREAARGEGQSKSHVVAWDDTEDDALERLEMLHGSADEFVRTFLIDTYRREVSSEGEFRWDLQR